MTWLFNQVDRENGSGGAGQVKPVCDASSNVSFGSEADAFLTIVYMRCFALR